MPNAPWQPGVSMSNGERVIEFIDTASQAPTTYTYLEEQDIFWIRNKGVADISVTVGSFTNQVVKPGETFTRSLSFTSFTVSTADTGTQEIYVRTTKIDPIPGGGTFVKRWTGVEVDWWGNSNIAGQGLTLAQHWITKIGNLNGMKNNIYGYPGKPWAYAGSGTDDTIYSNRAALSKTAKVVVIYSGGNDRSLDRPIGTVSDTSNTTFAGALNLAITYVQNNMPAGVMIIMATAFHRNGGNPVTTSYTPNGLGLTLIDYNEMAMAVARARGIYIMDLNSMGITPANISKYSTDGVHLNPAGADMVSYYGFGFFETMEVPAGSAPPDTEAPNPPTNLISTGKTSTSVTLSWTASTSSDVNGYNVYNGASKVGTVTATSATISGLTPDTSYTFTVKAKDAANNESVASNSVTVTTDAASGGGPTVYFNDTFTGPNGTLNGHVAETGQTWDTSIATTPANWTIASNAAKYTGTTGDKILINSGAPSGDYTVIATVLATGGKQGVAFRGLNGTNYLYAKYDSAAAGAELKLFKRSDATGTATTTQLASAAHTINTTSSHEFKIVISGDTINVYIAGATTPNLTHQLSTADATEYAGRTWVGMYAGGENTSQWNALVVQSNA